MTIVKYLLIFIMFISGYAICDNNTFEIDYGHINEFNTFHSFVKSILEKKFKEGEISVSMPINSKLKIKIKNELDEQKVKNILKAIELIYTDYNESTQNHLAKIENCLDALKEDSDCKFILSLFEKAGENANLTILLQLFLEDCFTADNFTNTYDGHLCSSKEDFGLRDVLKELINSQPKCESRLESFIKRLELEEKFEAAVDSSSAQTARETSEDDSSDNSSERESQVPAPVVEPSRSQSSTPTETSDDKDKKTSDKDLADLLRSLEGRNSPKVSSFIKNIADQVKSIIDRQNIKKNNSQDTGTQFKIPTSRYQSKPYVKGGGFSGESPDAVGFFEGEPTVVGPSVSMYKVEKILNENREYRKQIKAACKNHLKQSCSKIDMINFVQFTFLNAK